MTDRERRKAFHGLRRRLPGWLGGVSRGADVSAELEELMEQRRESDTPLQADEQLLLTNIFKLTGTTVADVMIPRADIVAVEVGSDLATVIKTLSDHGHSRLPVFRKSLDDTLGLVHIKDLVRHTQSVTDDAFDLKILLRPPIFIVPSMRIMDVLLTMRQKQTHMALVVDEFGGVDGLVTIEDVVEQIVGDIDDEHDVADIPEMLPQADGSLVADGRTKLDEFEEWWGRSFEDEHRAEVETIGGFVSWVAGRVPQRTEVIRYNDSLEFEVLNADPRKVKRIRVRKYSKMNMKDSADESQAQENPQENLQENRRESPQESVVGNVADKI